MSVVQKSKVANSSALARVTGLLAHNNNKCEISIPETKMELKDHLTKCKTELKKLNAKLIIVMNDIAIMTMILEMSDCDAKLLQQKKLMMLRCEDKCTKKHTVLFNH